MTVVKSFSFREGEETRRLFASLDRIAKNQNKSLSEIVTEALNVYADRQVRLLQSRIDDEGFKTVQAYPALFGKWHEVDWSKMTLEEVKRIEEEANRVERLAYEASKRKRS